MNAESIKKLQKQFVVVAGVAFLLVMLFAIFTVNILNFYSTSHRCYQILDYLIDNDGNFSNFTKFTRQRGFNDNYFSDEARYTLRFFTVVYDGDDDDAEAAAIILDHISSINEEEAIEYADNVQDGMLYQSLGISFGVTGNFYYEIGTDKIGNRVVAFVDSSMQNDINSSVFRYSIIIMAGSFFIILMVILFYSRKIIQPEIDNANRQKEFITNASHELKTPLAVIRANTEFLEMTGGENEWTQSTMRQVDRMNGLIQNLVMITKAQESEDRSILSEINASQIVKESADQFESVSQQEDKQLKEEIDDGINIKANESNLRQLVTLLVDNAVKYCDDNGHITVGLHYAKKGRTELTVSNNYEEGANVDYTKFFERFYRQDKSHQQKNEKGGYGIGLSLAQSIVTQMAGAINVSWKDGIITFTVSLPNA